MSNTDRSINQIAQILKEPANRVRYIINRHNIKANKRVGITGLYDETVQKLIKECLFTIRDYKTDTFNFLKACNRCGIRAPMSSFNYTESDPNNIAGWVYVCDKCKNKALKESE